MIMNVLPDFFPLFFDRSEIRFWPKTHFKDYFFRVIAILPLSALQTKHERHEYIHWAIYRANKMANFVLFSTLDLKNPVSYHLYNEISLQCTISHFNSSPRYNPLLRII